MTSPLVRVLLVDDHQFVRRGVRALVEEQNGYRIIADASDGEEALRLAQELQPNIAIVDYSLPRLNGLDLTRKMGRTCPKTAVLLYTMHDEAEIIWDVLRAGVRGFVLKSDPASNLLAALDALSIGRRYLSPTVLSLLPALLDSKPETSIGRLHLGSARLFSKLQKAGRINRSHDS